MSGAIGRFGLDLPGEVWRIACFFAGALGCAFRLPLRRAAITRQVRLAGRRTAGMALVAAAVAGTFLAFIAAGAEGEVGPLVSQALVREVAPALAAIAIAARAGAAITSELGALRESGHIDALEAAAVNTRQCLATPRILALLIGAPAMSAFVGLVGLVAACLFAVLGLGLDGATFMDHTRSSVGLADMSVGLVKATLFGALVAGLSTYRGFYGGKPLRALLESAVLILGLNFLLTAILDQIR